MRHRLLAGVTITGVLMASGAVGVTTAQAAPAPAASGVAWSTCADSTLAKAGAQCGMLAVPLDYAHPGGAKIQIALSRLRHTGPDSRYKGIMLVNPGGPGGSGLDLSLLKLAVPSGGGDDYDWIGWDPRGVGSSVPALRCDPQYFAPTLPPYVPTTRAIEAAWLAKARGYAQACAQSAAAKTGLLGHLTTVDNVRDMNSIRAALHSRVLNYYGFSYGTYLGQVFATLYPDRVGRMVLDSNVDPRRVWYAANLDQDVAFEKVSRIWFGWIAKYHAVYHLGASEQAVRGTYYRVLASLTRHPAGGVLGGAEWSDAFLYAGYVQFLWPTLADVFAGYVNNGDWKSVVQWAETTQGVGDDNGYAMYLATECTDAQWPTSWDRWRADNWRLYNAGNKFLTWGNAWYNAPCRSWPAPAGKPVQVTGEDVTSRILLVDETLDAATPYTGSLEVRRRFPTSRLIAEPGGTTHAGTLFGNACVDGAIAAYLSTGALPARRAGNTADKICAPLPQPVPTELAPATAAASTAGAAAARAAAVLMGPRGLGARG